MKKKVVIGAGPAGLYFAIQAVKKGLKNVVIYDPRAGNYTRPGHLNLDAFRKAEQGLDIHFWPGDKTGHIKDLERGLYAEAIRLGIPIKNQRFVRLHEDPLSPGVVVADAEGVEEIVEADYVFDCTGSRREVIAAVNQIVPESPLKMETITKPPVLNHILAYVKMSDADWSRLNFAKILPEGQMSALSYARSIVKLRALGWTAFERPRCYGVSFGKNKVCLYLHAPENLPPESKDHWVQAVLEHYTSPISYQHLPPSPKPRFVYFPMKAEALKEILYRGKNLPTVVALGDTQIDFDYALAHGIRDGMGRIDALFTHMEILNGEIYYFYPDEYLATIHEQLKEHKKAVINAADKIRRSFSDALESAQPKVRQASMLTNDVQEKNTFTKILSEIEARQSYENAKKLFAGYHYHTHPLKSLVAATDAAGKLNSIHSELVRALNGLPQAFTLERQDTQELLTHLALCWKETGNALFKNQSISGAIEAYKKALEIYNLADFIGQHGSQETPLYSNLAVCYLSEKRYRESIASANTCLEIAARCADESVPSTLKEKLVFNLLKAMCRQAQEFLTIPTRKELVPSLHLETKQLMEKHGDILSSGNYELLSTSIAEMEHQLAFLGQTTSLDSPRGVPAGAGATASAAKDSASKTEDASALRVLGQFAVKPKLPAQPQATQSCTLL